MAKVKRMSDEWLTLSELVLASIVVITFQSEGFTPIMSPLRVIPLRVLNPVTSINTETKSQ